LFGETEIMSTEPIQAFCGCSKAMFYPMLAGLGVQELKAAVAQERTIDMVCHACGGAYSFSPAEIAGLVTPP
jgi:molecular chaperone Hsp33